MRTVTRASVAIALIAVTMAAGAASAGASSRGGPVRSLASPPARAPHRFTLKISTQAARVTLYVAHLRRYVRGARKLGTFTVRRGRVTVILPRRLTPSAYFLIACPAGGRGRCAAARKPTVVLPAQRAVDRAATPALAGAGVGSATIGEAGGSVTASGPGGVTFTLTVPARSLPNYAPAACQFQQQFGFWRNVCPTNPAFTGGTVTLTPLNGLGGVQSLGRFISGVQLGPEGTLMIRGGAVTFRVPAKVGLKRLRVIGYAGSGSSAAPVPFRIKSGVVTVPVGVLGGGVAVLESGGTVARVAVRAPRVAGARAAASPGSQGFSSFYGQMLGSIVGEAHARALQGGNDSFTNDELSAMSSILTDWYNDIATQEIPGGLQDDGEAAVAIRDLLTWARTKALLGLGNGDVPPEVIKLLAGIYNRAQERCAQPHSVSAADMREIITDYRDLVLAGHPDDVPVDQLLSCMQLTVKFDSTITEVHGGTTHGTNINEYVTSILIKPNVTASELVGQGSGSYAQATGQEYSDTLDCGATGGGTFVSHIDELSGIGTSAQVSNFTLPSARIGGPAPMLELALGEPMESYHMYNVTSSRCVADTVQSLPQWFSDFLIGHKGEVSGTSGTLGTYVFILNPGGGPTLATRTYDQTFTVKSDTDSEHTAITVTHTPGSFPRL